MPRCTRMRRRLGPNASRSLIARGLPQDRVQPPGPTPARRRGESGAPGVLFFYTGLRFGGSRGRGGHGGNGITQRSTETERINGKIKFFFSVPSFLCVIPLPPPPPLPLSRIRASAPPARGRRGREQAAPKREFD